MCRALAYVNIENVTMMADYRFAASICMLDCDSSEHLIYIRGPAFAAEIMNLLHRPSGDSRTHPTCCHAVFYYSY